MKVRVRPRKKDCLFPVTVQKKRVGRSESFFFFLIFFVQKCVFYACFLMIGSQEG